MKYKTILKSSVCLAATFAYPVMFAQGEEAQKEERFALEEITVTARKREENLQDTPISITAFSANDLIQRTISNLGEIAPFTPNLEIGTASGGNGSSSSSIIYIRGIGQEDYSVTTDPGVGIYVDGVYFPRSVGSIMDLMDIERLEVLRGPQGTLFGKNTIGGALNIVSRKPDDEAAFSGEVNIGSYNQLYIKGTANIPVTDKVATKISFSKKDRDGYVKRIRTGDRQGGEDSLAVRGQLLWSMSDKLSMLISADVTKIREESSPTNIIWVNDAFPLYPLYNAVVAIPQFGESMGSNQVTGDPFLSNATGANTSDLDIWGLSLTLDWKGDAVDFKSITAYREISAHVASDLDSTPFPIVEFDIIEEQEQFSQEFQLNGTFLNEKLNLVAGVFYFYEKASDDFSSTIFGGLFETIGLDLSAHSINANKTESYAAYSQAIYAITDRLSATAGIRYTLENKDRTFQQARIESGQILIPPTQSDDEWTAWSPRFGLDFKATEDILFYGSISRGFKSGGFNARPSNVESTETPFAPEFVTSYEVGFRSDWFQNRLRFNSTAFFYDYKDIQTTASKLANDGFTNLVITENAAKAEVKGFEFELIARPVEELVLSVSGGYVDAKYTEVSPTATVVTLDTKFLKTPEWKINASAQYTVPLTDIGDLSFRVDYAYTGKVYNEQNNNELAAQEAFSIINTRITYYHPSDRWSLALGVTNLTNKLYKLNGRFAPLFVPVTYAPPRRWSASLKVNF